jgi:hypothetical protein
MDLDRFLHFVPSTSLAELLRRTGLSQEETRSQEAILTGASSLARSLTIDDAFMLAMIERIESLSCDLRAQIGEIQQRNTLKKLYASKLEQLQQMQAQVSAQRPSSDNDAKEIDVAAADFPWIDYAEVQREDGSCDLEPVNQQGSNEVTTDFRYNIVDSNGCARTVAQDWLSAVQPELDQGGTLQGYRLRVTESQIKNAIEHVKTKMDALNTDGEIATLRLNDLISKTQLATEQASKISQKRHDGLESIIKNI